MNHTFKSYIFDETLTNDSDLILFKAFLDDLCSTLSISKYRMLKEANLPSYYYQDLKRCINHTTNYRKTIKLSLILHIGNVWQFHFNAYKYIHLLEPKSLDVSANTIESNINKP